MTGDGLSPPLLGQVECDWVRKAALGSVEQALRPCLVAAYGSWCRSEGSSHQPDVWFHILVEAVRQEAKSVEDLVSLSAFALGAEVFAPTETAMLTLQDQWASPVLTRCLQTISDCALHTPESANTYLRSLCHHFRDTVGIRGGRSCPHCDQR